MAHTFDLRPGTRGRDSSHDYEIINAIADSAETISDLSDPDLDKLLDRIDQSRIVLLGEATHGTEEFYRLRARITKKLIEEKGFNLVAFEADWPDMEGVNEYIKGRADSWGRFNRFPEWMWRNTAFADFAEELRDYNSTENRGPVSAFGLDLYSLHASLEAVRQYFLNEHPQKIDLADRAYNCLSPWQHDPSQYGLAVWRDVIKTCEADVEKVLKELQTRIGNQPISSPQLLSALQNAQVAKNAEHYYRSMYLGSVESWNLRDRHMFDTLDFLLENFGPDSKVVVWEHNSHIGNAEATEMGDAGEYNLGQLCRQKYGDQAYLIGFMTNHGTVAAASRWGGPVEAKKLKPARSDSFEGLMHATSIDSFFLPLRRQGYDLRSALSSPRLERAVGVLYLPETERSSHYFEARLQNQFDEIVWIDSTTAVKPLPPVPETEESDTYPFGL